MIKNAFGIKAATYYIRDNELIEKGKSQHTQLKPKEKYNFWDNKIVALLKLYQLCLKESLNL
ncbi:MAG: hypothetical protein EBY21_08695 [Alphaproteobacteria bacterium]|nr:hypothetical protein [Alphaproteobacteria bacterium]